MPKKREVASLVGNFSPVKRRRASLVRRIRHFRGEIGDVLKTRAVQEHCGQYTDLWYRWSIHWRAGDAGRSCTFLEDRRAVDFDNAGIVFVLLVERHLCDWTARGQKGMERR